MGDDPNRIKPLSDIDVDAWRAEMIKDYGAIPNIDMNKWYELTVDRCNSTPSEMETFVAIGWTRAAHRIPPAPA